VYLTIDSEPHFSAQTYRGKVGLITGASRGVGAETGLAYARASASVADLTRWKRRKFAPIPGAQVFVVPDSEDIRDAQAINAAVRAMQPRFEKIDMVLANAGTATNLSEL